MKLADCRLSGENCFVAMEYYALILNRTLLVVLAEDHLIGIVAGGLTAVRSDADPLTALITGRLSVAGDARDPRAYLNSEYLDRSGEMDLLGDRFLRARRGNFRIGFDEITEVSYDPRKKWGMGGYPHDGRVYVTAGNRKRELIILGNQSGSAIARRLNERLAVVAARPK